MARPQSKDQAYSPRLRGEILLLPFRLRAMTAITRDVGDYSPSASSFPPRFKGVGFFR